MSNHPISTINNQSQNPSEFSQFIQSNQPYIEEKFHKYFSTNNQNDPQKKQIHQFPIQSFLLFIFDIFSLQRYLQNRKVYEAIKNSISENIKQFSVQNPNKTLNTNQVSFTQVISLLIFIVKNNSIFSIHYEKTSTHQQDLSKNQGKKTQMKCHVGIKYDEQNGVIDDQQNQHNPSSNMKSKVLKVEAENQFQNSSQIHNPYINDNLISENISQKLLKKNSKALFDFYCRQQMQLGGVITFDRLSEETNSMSVGKFLTFAKATNLYGQLIRREDVVAKFKRTAQGKKYINFLKFEALIAQFQSIDPNLNQRIGLLSEDIRKVLKYVKLPFNTKDIQPRQKIAVRNFSSKLTQHSGQSSEDLKFQIQRIKRLNHIKQYIQLKQNQSQIIRQNDFITSRINKKKDFTVDLSFIGSIIHPQEDDKTYLKDHLIPRLEKPLEKKQKLGNIFDTQRYKSQNKLTLRKQSVVSDIRKRIKEIESNQNLKMRRGLARSRSPGKKYTQN